MASATESPAIDSVEKLFSMFIDPESEGNDGGVGASAQLFGALEAFIKDPPSPDPDYKYLLTHAKEAVASGKAAVPYFRQQLAYLAVEKQPNRKDKSKKARQLKYHRWMAYGLKTETYPFPKGKPSGPPSTTRIAAIVSPTSCAACGKKGVNMRCPDCNFQDDKFIVKKTVYCNKKCLQDHYKAHQSVCECRRSIYRAAELLHNIFITLEEATFVFPLGEIFQRSGMVYLIDDAWDRAGMTGRYVFTPFPKHLASEELHHALLLWGRSEELSLSLFTLINYLFGPMCKSMEQVLLQPRNVIRPMCQISMDRVLNVCLHKHMALKVSLRSGEDYIIDLTGAQFGWKETLAPFLPWIDLRSSKSDGQIFKPACRSIRTLVQQNVLESFQLEVRSKVLKSVISELHQAMRDNATYKTFNQVIQAPLEDYKRAERNIMELVQQKIYMLVKNEYYQEQYRLWLGRSPCSGPQIAKQRAKDLKDVWMTTKEYDRLRKSGANMSEIWDQRLKAKFGENVPN
ncbi:hypothetical protein F5Y14DRAFT_457063 [Nemania sp. NC0429]|nr:hypothetical protein F5Y14DRAFT_457063 [Nemania sp. NC0429]